MPYMVSLGLEELNPLHLYFSCLLQTMWSAMFVSACWTMFGNGHVDRLAVWPTSGNVYSVNMASLNMRLTPVFIRIYYIYTYWGSISWTFNELIIEILWFFFLSGYDSNNPSRSQVCTYHNITKLSWHVCKIVTWSGHYLSHNLNSLTQVTHTCMINTYDHCIR